MYMRTVIADRVAKGKFTISVIVTYFNSVAHMNFLEMISGTTKPHPYVTPNFINHTHVPHLII